MCQSVHPSGMTIPDSIALGIVFCVFPHTSCANASRNPLLQKGEDCLSFNILQTQPAVRFSVGQSILAGLLILLLCLSSLLAASPTLHKLLHEDAAQDSHQCAITLLHQQGIEPSNSIPVLLESAQRLLFLQRLTQTPVFMSVDCRSFPSRAPPCIFLS